MKPTLSTLLSSTYNAFVSTVSDFIATIQQQTITLDSVEKFLRPLVLDTPSESEAQKILENTFLEALWLTDANPISSVTRKVKISDLSSCFHSICKYLRFLAIKEVIAELLKCARYVFLSFVFFIFIFYVFYLVALLP